MSYELRKSRPACLRWSSSSVQDVLTYVPTDRKAGEWHWNQGYYHDLPDSLERLIKPADPKRLLKFHQLRTKRESRFLSEEVVSWSHFSPSTANYAIIFFFHRMKTKLRIECYIKLFDEGDYRLNKKRSHSTCLRSPGFFGPAVHSLSRQSKGQRAVIITVCRILSYIW